MKITITIIIVVTVTVTVIVIVIKIIIFLFKNLEANNFGYYMYEELLNNSTLIKILKISDAINANNKIDRNKLNFLKL